MTVSNNRGFTLVEMVVVIGIFLIILTITLNSFDLLLKQSVKLSKSEESNIEGVVGLEMMRHDLEQVGFGLPDSYQSPAITYREAGYAPASALNDAPSGVPRAIASVNNQAETTDTNSTNGGSFKVLGGTDYLAIKASSLGGSNSVGGNDASQKWTYLTYSSSGRPAKTWPTANFVVGDKVIMVSRTFDGNGNHSNQLAYDTTQPGSYWTSYANTGYSAAFSPQVSQIFYLYGLTSGSDVGMPFNRVDYFVATPSGADSQLPSSCAPNTGILYKASVNHSASSPGGKLTYTPILDCVADMQVVYGWNLADSTGTAVTDSSLTGNGLIDTWSNADGSTSSGITGIDIKNTVLTDAGHIRTKLKVIKVYLLVQDGLKDPKYTAKSPISIGDDNEKTITRPGGFVLTSDMLNYRWRVYRLVIKPKNLISNQ